MLSPLLDRVRELRRRRVFHVAAVYAVVSWGIVEVAETTFPHLGLPDRLITAVIVMCLLGFPLALVLAWALELTPEGVRRQSPPPGEVEPGPDAATGPLPAARSASPGPATSPARPRLALAAVAAVVTIAVVGGAIAAGSYRRGHAAPDGVDVAAYAAPNLSQLTFSADVEAFPAFSPDGRHLVYSREVPGMPRQLFLKDLQTGEEVQLTREVADHIQPAFTPDGGALLYVRSKAPEQLRPRDLYDRYDDGGAIWRMDLGTRRAELLVDEAWSPDPSPDGGRIAFEASWSGVRRIWVADAWGRNPQMLTADASDVVTHMAPRWSPDGTRLVYRNVEKGTFDIHVVDVADRRVTRLTNDQARDLDPAWLNDAEVVFTSARGGGLNLWRIRLPRDGSAPGAPVQVTTGAGQDVQPAVARDGRIAFVTMNQNSDVWRMPLDPATGRPAGPPTPLVTSTREDSRGTISPDGRLLAFNSDRTGDMNVWVLDLEGGATRQLTSGPGGDYQARWSPDGNRLAFFSSRAGHADIWEVNVLTGALRRLTTDAGVDVNPVYSHAGDLIAFQSDRDGRKNVWVMDANGLGQRQLTHTGAGDHYMAWTPDDEWIIFASPTYETRQVSVRTGEVRPFHAIRGGAHFSFPPDHRFAVDVAGHTRIWLSPLDGGEPVMLLEFDDPDVRIDYTMLSPDAGWLVFDRLKPTGGDIWLIGPPAPASR